MLEYIPGFQRSLRVLEGLTEATVVAYTRKINEFAAWLQGNGIPADIATLSRSDIEAYMEWCFYRSNVNITRLTKLTALSKFFRYLKYEGLITEDITLNIPRPRIRKKLMLTFTKDEIIRLFSQCDITKEKGIRNVCLLIFFVFCGLRMNEAITLDLNSIIDDGKDIDIYVKGKQGHDRQVYIWKVPGIFLRQWYLIRLNHGAKGSDPFLVSCRGKQPKRRLTAAPVDYFIKSIARKAGIRRAEVHTHMLRATHANDLQHIKGYTLPAIQERMGWLDLSTAGRYLVRRERIHRQYDSLHQYWSEFTKIWKPKEGSADADSRNHNAANDGGPDIA